LVEEKNRANHLKAKNTGFGVDGKSIPRPMEVVCDHRFGNIPHFLRPYGVVAAIPQTLSLQPTQSSTLWQI
jgi:hypothetical protein